MKPLRLGVNIDHVATVRNARGGDNPDPVRAALMARESGRRRHHRASARGPAPYLRRGYRAAVARIGDSAQSGNGRHRRDAGDRGQGAAPCRLHRAGEARGAHHRRRHRRGGAFRAAQAHRRRAWRMPASASLCSSSPIRQLDAAQTLGAPVVELHTGAYANAGGARTRDVLKHIHNAAAYGASSGLRFMPATVSPTTMSSPSPRCRKSANSISAIS